MTKMKITLLLPLLLLLACSTPTKQWVTARYSLDAATEVAIFSAEQKMINDEQIVSVDKTIKVARAALNKAESKLPNGGTSFQDYIDIVLAAVAKLNELRSR